MFFSHFDRQSVLSGLPRPADRRLPSTTNLVHAFICRQTECSARSSSACRQAPSLDHQPSECFHMSTDRVFCQVFLGLLTGACPSTTNLVHVFTCRQTECSARSSSACRQAPSLDHQPSACFHMSTDRVFCQVFLGLPTGAFPSTTNLVHVFFHISTDRVFCQVFLGLPTGAFPRPPT